MASPAGGYYVCKTYFIVGGRKIRHLGGTNQFKPSRRPRLTELKKYLKERHPQGGENLAIFSTGGYFLRKYHEAGISPRATRSPQYLGSKYSIDGE